MDEFTRNTIDRESERKKKEGNPDNSLNVGGSGMDMYLSPVSFWWPEHLDESAWIDHAPFAFWLMETLRPRTFVELGTHGGYSYFAFCQAVNALKLATRCYAVDTWKGDEHADFYGEEVFERVQDYNERHYVAFSRLIRSTFDEALAHFSNGSIDLLHIDGRHFYEDVKHDFESWRPKLSERSVVLFHDTDVRERNFGIFRLWEELQTEFPAFEFLHGHGLGVLGYGSNLPEGIKAFFKATANSRVATEVRSAYGRLGASLTADFDYRQTFNTLQAQAAERNGQIANLNQAVAKRDRQIAAILSNSDKKPKARERQLSTVNLRDKTKTAEDLLSTVRKVNQILRREGMPGLRRRLAMAVRDYPTWISRYDTLTDKTREKMRQIAGTFAHKPLISIVMPCYNPKPEWLREAIESVRRQIYPHWELCIADDASTDPAIRPILEVYSRRDTRIRVVFREANGHICAASNSALALAAGEYVALLDHDDLLAEHALFWVAEAINRHPDAGLIYSDEDKITESGLRIEPYFKCDWNYDLFLSQNMICHLGVYNTGLLRKIGGFREGLEGAQDYDLALRCIEQLDASQIIHIPRVLYHWRVHPDSVAMSAQAKPYAYVAVERALNDHLARKGVSAQAERHPEICFYRVRYSLPKRSPLVTLIIPTRNGLRLIRQCLSSILEKTDYPNYEILVVDNGSDDPQTLAYFDTIRSDPRVHILRDDRPFNYSALNNRAVQVARGELIGLVNNDIEVISSEWLTEMVSIALQPGVGAVGARLWYPNNTLQHGGVVFAGGFIGHSHKHLPKGHPGYFNRAILQQSFSAVTAACLVVRRSIFLEVGGLEEEHLKVAFNDVDFCLRVREAGYRNVWTPYAEAYHHEMATRGYDNTPEKRARALSEGRYMRDRWGSLLANDPAYSPNLTLEGGSFSYAWPPRVAAFDQTEFNPHQVKNPKASGR